MKNNKWKRRTEKNQSAEIIWFHWNFSIAWSFEQSEKYSCSIVSISSWKIINERDEHTKINQQKQFELIENFSIAWSFEQSEKYSCPIDSISSWKIINERDEKPKINQQKQFDLI
jgi:type IV secretory pathway component VirB8